MLRWKRAVCLIVLLGAMLGCGGESLQPERGHEWRLIQVREGNPAPAIAVAPLGPSQLVVSITVMSGCADGGNAPRFLGFEIQGDAVVARIARAPVTPSCLSFSNTVFDLAVDASKFPDQALRFTLGGAACPPEDSFCLGVSAPFRDVLATPLPPAPSG